MEYFKIRATAAWKGTIQPYNVSSFTADTYLISKTHGLKYVAAPLFIFLFYKGPRFLDEEVDTINCLEAPFACVTNLSTFKAYLEYCEYGSIVSNPLFQYIFKEVMTYNPWY